MAVTRDGRASDRRRRRARARLRAGAERLRPPLHLLHHPLRPRQFALGADGRGGRAGAHAVRARLSRGRAHRRRSHQLRRRICRARRGSARWSSRSSSTCRSWRGCGSRRSIRSRPIRDLLDALAERRAADAASASVAAGGRRSHPQAHEAAAPARRCHRVLRAGAAACGPTWCSAPTSSPASRPKPRTMFARSLDLVDECGLTHLHVFPFSPRPGTPAARMPQVAPTSSRSARAGCARKATAALRRHLDARGRRTAPRADRVATASAAPSISRRCGSLRRSCRGMILDLTIAGHDGRQLLAA